MSIKDQISAEIERRLKAIANSPSDGGEMDAINGARCLELTSFRKYIDSLPEQPVEGLDEEIVTWIPAHISGGDDEVWKDTKNAVTEWAEIVARHFAEWGAEHLKGWHSVEESLPEMDEEVIVLKDKQNTGLVYEISFGHLVDTERCIDYNGWNVPDVKFWMPMPKIPEEKI